MMMHKRITHKLLRKYWQDPSINFGGSTGKLEKEFPFDYSADLHDDSAGEYAKFIKYNFNRSLPIEDNIFGLATCFGTITLSAKSLQIPNRTR